MVLDQEKTQKDRLYKYRLLIKQLLNDIKNTEQDKTIKIKKPQRIAIKI